MSSPERPELTDRRLLVVIGTRPEAIKLARVIAAVDAHPQLSCLVAVTGQHRRMLQPALDFFGIVPDIDLAINREGEAGLNWLAARTIECLGDVLVNEQPDMLVVQGDTTTAVASALAAFQCSVPVAHIEAGLRTFDRTAPYPEEINRRLIADIASIHLAPTAVNRSNLLAQQVPGSCIYVTGNTVIDALHWSLDRESGFENAQLAELEREERRVLLVTAHRRESWGPAMSEIAAAIGELAEIEPDLAIVIPVHQNPVVRDAFRNIRARHDKVLLLEPQPYGVFVRLLQLCDLILTDSGGLQEEGPALGKPVLVMRAVSERPEAVAVGASRLVGTSHSAIVSGVRSLLHDQVAYRTMAEAINPYGDGCAARRCVDAVAHHLGLGLPPKPFAPVLPREVTVKATTK